IVDLKTANGTILKGTYFDAAKPGPGVLLFHQSNRTRQSWDDVARQLAAAGINALTVDTDPNKTRKQQWPGELDATLEFLVSQPGVNRDVVGIGGAGVIGVEDSVETARLHPAAVKSLVLLSGETESLDFLRQASQLPELFVVADDDEYPPIVEAMELLYITSSNSGKKFVHYSAAQEAPWLWYEPFDIGKVPAKGGHGTDFVKHHPELPDIIASVHLREGDAKTAIEIFKLNLLAFPDSADAHYNLADAYLADGQKELARQYAEKALALLDSHAAPLSSWSDTEQRRGEIRRSAERTLQKLDEKPR